jgi:hypothetical protein
VASVWRLLIGPPLRAREVSRERITPVEGLSALSLDALTSVAYGPEAIIVVLAVAGAGALHLVLPITVTIVILLAILVFSYRQVIDAYPGGGGAYAVSRANLGAWVGLVAAGALVVDYTLTVAVSIAAGVAAMTSAFPGLGPVTVPICLAILAVVTLLNLRGLGDAARAFLLPTMVFIVGLLAIIVIGLIHPLALHAPQPGHSLITTPALETVSVLLLLKAFSAGCSALTGVEAIANGVPLFKQPRVARAKRTELLLGSILGAMLLGLAVLARRWHIGPRSGQTVLSQIMAMAIGRHWAFYVMSLTITLVLALAANTSFGGLPVLASLLGAWVVVIAVPAFMYLFTRIHRYYRRAGRALGLGEIPGKPQVKPTVVVVPVAAVSRLAQYAIGQALSISEHVIAVTVALEDPAGSSARAREIERQWARWDPGVPLRVLHTEYASVAEPIVAFIDRLREHHDKQVVVLIPVALPDRLRYEFLHNHFDLVLTAALRARPDVVSARIPIPLHVTDGDDPVSGR